MQQKQSVENGQQNDGDDQDARPFRSCTMICVAFWAYVLVAALLWVVIHDNITEPGKSFEVFIASAFSLAIVIVVIIHAYMYFRQAVALDSQLAQTKRGLEITERAYVGVGSIALASTRNQEVAKREMQDLILTIENSGRLPADQIFVKVAIIILVPQSVQAKMPNSLMRYYFDEWYWNFKTTKLFRGNVNFEIRVPIPDRRSAIEWSRVSGGHARCITQIRIDYSDGFRTQRADYAFRFEGQWIPWWAWTSDNGDDRVAEEIGRYPQYNT